MELHKGLFSCHLFQGMDSEKAENIIRRRSIRKRR